MRTRWAIAGALAMALVAGATGLAASGGAVQDRDRNLGAYFFGPNMARAEVVMVLRGHVVDFRIDQGRVVAARGGTVEILERDGTRHLVPVAPNARVTLDGAQVPLSALQRGMAVVTVREGGAPAGIVRASQSRRAAALP